MKKYLALDGGATKTFTAVYNENAEILGIGVAGPSNYRNIGEENAISNINDSVRKALDSSGTKGSELDSSTFAIAGVKDSNRSTEIIKSIVERTKVSPRFQLFNDGEAGFYSRFLDQDGLIVAPGTGMIAYCKYRGRLERASGWGWLIGDEGGAFYIGKNAISAFAKISDHRMPFDEKLHEEMMRLFGVTHERDIVNQVYQNTIDIRFIASLAATVSRLADGGSETCRQILKQAASEAALCAIGLHESLQVTDHMEISGYGGVFRSGAIYWNTLKDAVREQIDNVGFVKPIYGYHAVTGSILMKLKSEGFDYGKKDIDRIVNNIDQLVNKLDSADRKNYLFI
ncbi:MAG: N-acetylglucosamine kinase [Thermoplasmata archaeon]